MNKVTKVTGDGGVIGRALPAMAVAAEGKGGMAAVPGMRAFCQKERL